MNAPDEFGVLPPIPVPRLQEIENDTPYAHLAFDKMGKGRLFYDVVVCKATFALAPGLLQVAETPQPVEMADRYWDEENAEISSLRIAGDVLLTKPATDVLVTGAGRTHDGMPRPQWQAGLRVTRGRQTLVEHLMRLLGPRTWRHALLGGWTMSAPEPAVSVPLRHELAYGGHHPNPRAKKEQDALNIFAANPAGCGYWDPGQLDKSTSYPAPQIEPPNQPVQKMGADYPLVAPAPLARFWADRVRHGGTYDDAWLAQYHASVIPDYPHDFDPRFFQCAHPKLICPDHLRGDERLALAGLVPGEHEAMVCALPGISIRAEVIAADGRGGERRMALDTLHIDLDNSTVALTWRLTLDQRAGIERVRLSEVRLAETEENT